MNTEDLMVAAACRYFITDIGTLALAGLLIYSVINWFLKER